MQIKGAFPIGHELRIASHPAQQPAVDAIPQPQVCLHCLDSCIRDDRRHIPDIGLRLSIAELPSLPTADKPDPAARQIKISGIHPPDIMAPRLDRRPDRAKIHRHIQRAVHIALENPPAHRKNRRRHAIRMDLHRQSLPGSVCGRDGPGLPARTRRYPAAEAISRKHHRFPSRRLLFRAMYEQTKIQLLDIGRNLLRLPAFNPLPILISIFECPLQHTPHLLSRQTSKFPGTTDRFPAKGSQRPGICSQKHLQASMNKKNAS